MGEMTPMMRQYLQIKHEYPDSILFFRLGDFYEMFFEDARVVSRELDLVLTGKNCGLDERAPMCGIPFHSVDSYLAKLVSRGYKVAICEQTEDPAAAKGVVKREVVKILTPGTVIDSSMLDESRNNYLASFYYNDNVLGVCFADISTGTVHVTSKNTGDVLRDIMNEFAKYSPTEVIIDKSTYSIWGVSDFLRRDRNVLVEITTEDFFEYTDCKNSIDSLIKCSDKNKSKLTKQSIGALGACVKYLHSRQMSDLDNIRDIDVYSDRFSMALNYSSRRNLELTETLRYREKKGTLLSVLDKTKCAMGKRKLRSYIENPLVEYDKIIARQNAVNDLYNNIIICDKIRSLLSEVNDIERIMAKVTYGSANAKDLRNLASSLEILPEIKTYEKYFSCDELKKIFGLIDELNDIYELINSSIDDNPPFSVREGKMIKEGFDKELDELRSLEKNSKDYMDAIQERERNRTGITKLKVSFNKVFGYYIEVSNSFLDKVPEDYIRKQTLTNCERFITQELKELEVKILSANERVVSMEYEFFCKIRDEVASNYARINKTANAISILDAVCSLAYVAKKNNYCRAQINTDGIIKITDGRHPVVEQMLKDSPFVPNDTVLDADENLCAILTGPNMAGKSTYMRQVALIVIMAQIGSFVPASNANISICDSIFTRVGASDDLASGQSTFMVEMSEVAEILKNATKDSLIIYDEIGRGTSTFDGMSIARAVLEYTVKVIGAKTLFATHYHELTEIENSIYGVKNYNIAIKKRGDDLTFLRRIVRGCSDGSYGVEVAKLAGVPEDVVERAKMVLSELESAELSPSNTTAKLIDSSAVDFEQLHSESSRKNDFIEQVKQIDANTLTPIEALTKLYELTSIASQI